ILNKDYILISFIQGKTLKDAFGKSPRKVQENLAYQLGELARKIHSITSEKIGNHEDLLGNVYNWRDRYKQEFLKYFTTAKEKSYCPDKTFEKIEKIFLEFLEIKEIKSKLVHSDFSVSNIQIHEGKIVGIFDFEWAHWGDPLWDLQKLPINFQLGNKFSQSLFLKGYGIKHFNEEETLRLKMHAIHQGLWEIWATKNKIYPFSDKEIKEGENLIQIALTEKHFG
ncbi:MAG: aminoglycoside phosphotransferase family protein, partial [Patescibacteria group bacterium]|nr:aminoglycoside phosphotransferase family protein [Patescibacteria group bacterium]